MVSSGRAALCTAKGAASDSRSRWAAASALSAPEPFDQDHELVAAEAADRVRFAQGALEADGGLAQHVVAHAMAERVVDVLEPVEVDEEHGPVVSACAGPAFASARFGPG